MANEAWVEITDKRTGRGLMKNFSDKLAFKPHTKEFPGIDEPSPSITYRISFIWETDIENHRRILIDFHTCAYKAFRRCAQKDQWLFTTDVYHCNYRFYPQSAFEGSNPDAWKTPLFPNGEYSIFVSKSCSFGLFGHPWEKTICIFGASLISTFEIYKPELFRDIIRKNGRPATKCHPGA